MYVSPRTNLFPSRGIIPPSIRCAQSSFADGLKAAQAASQTVAGSGEVIQLYMSNGIYWESGPGHHLSIDYSKDSTEEDPIVIAKGVDYNGISFEKEIHINDVDPTNATYMEMAALSAHLKIPGQLGPTTFKGFASKSSYFERRNYICDMENEINQTIRRGESVKNAVTTLSAYMEYFKDLLGDYYAKLESQMPYWQHFMN